MNRLRIFGPPLAMAALIVVALITLAVVRSCAPAPAAAGARGEPRAADAGPSHAAALPSLDPRPAPEWGERPWLHTAPLSWSALRGHPVLVRFWTDGCPYCARTAPALSALERRYGPRGLVVIGVYHPKPRRAVTVEEVERYASALSMSFPVTIDADWSLLRRYWLDHVDSEWTSVSFLMDGEGIIRHVHPGGEFHSGGGPEHAACNESFEEMERRIEALLAAPPES